jgi:DNA-binding beta-propeller fold protein YncE
VREGALLKRWLLTGVFALSAFLLLAQAAFANGELSFVDCLQKSATKICGASGLDVTGLPGVADVVATPDGKDVFATSTKGLAIMRFSRGRNGHVKPIGQIGSGHGASAGTSLAVSPDGKNIYMTLSHPGAILTFNRSAHTFGATGCVGETGSVQCGTTAPGLGGADDVAVSHDGRNVYVASAASDALAVFKRGAGGQLTFEECISDDTALAEDCSGSGGSTPGLGAPFGVALDTGGHNVYVTGSQSNTLVTFERDPVDGSLSPIGCIPATGSTGCNAAPPPPPLRAQKDLVKVTSPGLVQPTRLAVTGDGKSVYVASGKPGAVAAFRRNSAIGALTPLGCIGTSMAGCAKTVAGLGGAFGITVNPDGKHVYATGFGDSAVVTLKRGASGALSYDTCVAKTANICPRNTASLAGASGLAITPDGQDVYVAASKAGALVHLTTGVPVLGKLHLKRTAFRVAKKPGQGGTLLTYTDTVASTTRFVIERMKRGVRAGRKCLPASRHTHSREHCTLLVRIGKPFAHHDVTGSNQFVFDGRVKGKKLQPGSYELVATASDAAGPSNARRTKFRIVK